MDKRNKMFYLTLLSVLSSFAVVLLHTNGCFWDYSIKRYWFTANIIEGLFYFAVPIFFMITGVTLLDYSNKYSLKEYFIKRFTKTFIPFFFWSFICLIFQACINGTIGLDTFHPVTIIDSIMNIKINDYYWYFPALFGVYFSIPVLSAISENKKIEICKYIVIMTVIFNYILPLFFNYVLGIRYGNNYYFHIGSRYIGYICTGYLLHNIKLTKKNKFYIYILGMISLLTTIIMTYYLSAEASKVVSTFIKYESLTQYFYAVMIFVLFKDLCHFITNTKIRSVINYIGQYTFSIYLVHWFFIKIFIDILKVNEISIVYRIGGAIGFYIGSIIVIKILRKIPVMRRFLP